MPTNHKKLPLPAIQAELSGHKNRRALIKHSNQYFSDQSNSVLMLDIDHFAQINMTYGMAAGNQVLEWFGIKCKARLRLTDDILTHLGNDDFVIFLPYTGSEEAKIVAERLRNEIDSSTIPHEKGNIHITTSIGVATNNQQAEVELETLLNQADHALYRAKLSGGNCVCQFDDGEGDQLPL